jgi:hypothetical protein
MSHSLVTSYSKLQGTQLDYIVMDGSGSMKDKWWEMLRAIDTFTAILARANLNTHILASVFTDGAIGQIQCDKPLSDHLGFEHDPLRSTFGYTPLYDAISAAGFHLQDLDPPRASVLFVTDGEENSSKFTTAAEAAKIIEWMRAKGYQVTFFGCDFNNLTQAAMLGVSDKNAVGTSKARLAEATAALARKRIEYGRFGKDMDFSNDEKEQFGGYLSPPSGDKEDKNPWRP